MRLLVIGIWFAFRGLLCDDGLDLLPAFSAAAYLLMLAGDNVVGEVMHDEELLASKTVQHVGHPIGESCFASWIPSCFCIVREAA